MCHFTGTEVAPNNTEYIASALIFIVLLKKRFSLVEELNIFLSNIILVASDC